MCQKRGLPASDPKLGPLRRRLPPDVDRLRALPEPGGVEKGAGGGRPRPGGAAPPETGTTLETTRGQIDGFFSQLPYKCHQNRVATVGG